MLIEFLQVGQMEPLLNRIAKCCLLGNRPIAKIHQQVEIFGQRVDRQSKIEYQFWAIRVDKRGTCPWNRDSVQNFFKNN